MSLYTTQNLNLITLMQAEKGFYFIGKGHTGFLKQKFQHLVGHDKPGQQVVEVVMGRKLQVLFHNLTF